MELQADGCTIIPAVMTKEVCDSIADDVENALSSQSGDAIGSRRGGLVGGRNLIAVWSGWRAITDQAEVSKMIREHVGPDAGLVRILYFDKPPGSSWSLSLHRDRTIAVAQHHVPPAPFAKPTKKAGVPHVEANDALLSQMLTLRLHLDPMREENGPVVVVLGSHADRPTADSQTVDPVYCQAGDVFVMRPLLSHGSRAASPQTRLHRRVVHLEIAPSPQLPAPYQWHQFVPVFDE